MSAAAVRAGRAYVEFLLYDQKLQRGLKRTEARLRMFGQSIQSIGTRAITGAFAGIAAFAFPIMAFAKFDDQIRELGAVSRASAKDVERLRTQAKQLGRETSFTAQEVAGSQTELARAGFNPDEIEAATPAILNLARATRTELPRAAEVAASTLRSFGLQAGEMPRVADTITAAANASALGFEDMAEAMKYAAPIADEFGLTLEDTAKNIGSLANVGIKGSQAGTSLRTVMLRLSSPKVRKEIGKYAKVTDEATGGFRNLADIMHDLAAATEDMPAAERLSLFNSLFGKNAITGAVKLATSDFQDLNAAIDSAAGGAKKTADAMDAGLGGAIRITLSAAEGAILAIGDAVSGTVTEIGKKLQTVFGVIARIVEKNPRLVSGLLKVFLAMGSVGGVLLSVGIGVRFLAFGIGGLATALKTLGLGLSAAKAALASVGMILGVIANPIGLVTAAVIGLAGYFLYTSGAVQALASYLGDILGPAWDAITAKIADGNLAGAGAIAMDALRLAFEAGKTRIVTTWNSFTGELARVFLHVFGILEMAWIKFSTNLVSIFRGAVANVRALWRDVGNVTSQWIAATIAVSTGQSVEDVQRSLAEDQTRNHRDYQAEAQMRTAEQRSAARIQLEHNERNIRDVTQTSGEDTARANADAMAKLEQKRADFLASLKDDAAVEDAVEGEDGLAAQDDTPEQRSRRIAAELEKSKKKGRATADVTDAVLLQSTEGQRAILEALGLKSKDQTTAAIEDLTAVVADEGEKTRRENRKAPRLGVVAST